MRIEKIELIGFKSFVEKTTFNLHPGITCIVGPNGSGKSNIVDSFRWVLGEQSAKSLRGDKMEEVIFNGSTTKKPRGMAEVNLMLLFDSPEESNGNSRSQTSVSRRLYRSGDSEYLINRNACRLKDIRDLFLDTGLEVRSYSILEQGRISEILNSKPQERRFLIEEVAGVMKYKVRRAEAQSKLESSRSNLQRIQDIVVEVRRQINSLDRQVKKAERFKKLSAEARDVELRLAKRDYRELKDSLDSVTAQWAASKENEAVVRAELDTIENTRESKRIVLLEKEKSLESLTSDLHGLEREIAEGERAIAVLETEKNHLKESLNRLSLEETEIIRKIGEVEERKVELTATETGLSGEIDNLKIELSEKNETIRVMEEELSEKGELIESKRREVFRIAEDLSHLRTEIGRCSTSLENLEKKAASASRESEAAAQQLTSVEEAARLTDQTLIGKNNELLLLTEKKEKLIGDIEAYRGRLDDVRAKIATAREAFASASSRLGSLREIMHEEFSKEVLTEAEKLHILASIAEVIEVEEAYERTIENALAEKVNGFILPSFEDVSVAASLFRQKGIGRTVFIPRDGIAAESGGSDSIARHELVAGRALDFVKVQRDREVFSPVIEALLGKVLVVRDLSAAFSLHDADNRFTFVTLEGEIVEQSGAVILGEGKGILRRKREIRELDSLISHRKAEIEDLEGSLVQSEAAFQEKKGFLKDVEAAIIDGEKEISLLRLTADNQSGEREKINRKLAYLHIEQGEVSREKESLNAVMREKVTEAEKVEAKKAEAEQLISDMQNAIAQNRERYETERASVTELRLSLNSYRERMESLRKDLENALNMLADYRGTMDRIVQEKTDVEAGIVRHGNDIEKSNEALKTLIVKADSLKAVIAENRETIRAESEDLTRIEQEAKALRSRLDTLTARVAEAEVSLAEHRVKLENLSEGVRQNYGIEIDTLEVEPVAPEDEGRLAEIREKIQELGIV
ncbi:MAG TPA: chromosome segregation protein SMC, partial [Thermodesulfovibrionales bacterium]|nr:chromosome segregation protein SMC [Thermodesulfovibrionales bacterium]